jgi:hypothetical protein
MEYDHLIVPGKDYRQTKEAIVTDVEKQARDWLESEVKLRVKSGISEADARKVLEADTNAWKDKEVQRRLQWECQEESTQPCD